MPQSVGLNLISRLLEDGRLADFYRLKREYFYDREIAVYDRLNSHVVSHGVLPTLSFMQRHIQIDAPDSSDPYGVWYDEYTSRALYNQFSAMLPDLQRDLANTQSRDALDRVTKFVEETHSIRADGQRDLSNVIEIGREVIEEFTRLRSMRGLSGIPSGWPTLDRTTHGFQRGDLIIFSARPGIGKSTVAIKLALEAHKAGFIPLFVSMEMKRVQIGARLLTMDSRLNMVTLRRGELTNCAQYRLEEGVTAFAAKQPFYFIEGQFRQSVNEIASLVHSLRPDILIVDGAYLLKLPGASSRMPLWEKIGEITQILKSIISTANIPGIATFQINREGGRRDRAGLQDAGLEHLQLSDAIGQLASLIVAILSDEGGDDVVASTQRRMKILKGREGESGQWFVHWDFTSMNFDEVADIVGETVHPEPEMGDLIL
jgi:replicative DNA helicase